MANTADIVALFVLVETPAAVLDRVLQDNAKENLLWQLWLADPAVLPRKGLEDSAEDCGTITPVDCAWRSPFLGKTPQECGDWLSDYGGKTGVVETKGGGRAKIDRCHFVVLNDGLKVGGWLTLCTMFDPEEVMERQTQLAEEWIHQTTYKRGGINLTMDHLSTGDQEEVEDWVNAKLEIQVGVNCSPIDVGGATSFVMTAYTDQWRHFHIDGVGSVSRKNEWWYADALASKVREEETSQPNVYEEETDEFLSKIDTTIF